MRKLLHTLAVALLGLAVAGLPGGSAQAATPTLTLSSPCYELANGLTWVYWTVANQTGGDVTASLTGDTLESSFTVPANTSVVRETLLGYSVELRVAGQVVDTGTVSMESIQPCGLERSMFSLIIECRPSPYQVTLRIRNASDRGLQYRLVKQRGEELTGTALPGNTYITEDWVKPTDRWKLTIGSYDFVRPVDEPPLCSPATEPSAPTRPSSPPPAPSPSPSLVAGLMDPASSVSGGLASNEGLVLAGLAALVVGSALGTGFGTVVLRRRRHA